MAEYDKEPLLYDRVMNRVDQVLNSRHRGNVLIVGLVIFSGLVLTGLYVPITYTSKPSQPQGTEIGPAEQFQTFYFECAGGSWVRATFPQGRVDLLLSDGRQLALPQVISASGARYANPDESFVFWNKGTTAFIQENGVETYSGCVTS